MKGRGRITIPKEVRKTERKRDFFIYLLTKNGFVKIKKLEFNFDKAIKQIERLKKKNYC